MLAERTHLEGLNASHPGSTHRRFFPDCEVASAHAKVVVKSIQGYLEVIGDLFGLGKVNN